MVAAHAPRSRLAAPKVLLVVRRRYRNRHRRAPPGAAHSIDATASSSSLEHGVALFGERLERFTPVFAAETFVVELELAFETRFEPRRTGRIDGAKRRPQGNRR